MSKINAINNKASELTVDPGASGDSFVQFNINATGEFRIGVDDDAGDSFKISQGSALGTNDTFVMTASGERTMPLQSCFLAHINSDISNVLGDNNFYTVVWDSEEFDQGGDFDGTSTFTAPVTGRYFFSTSVLVDSLTSSYVLGIIQFVASGDTYRCHLNNPGAIATSGDLSLFGSAIIPMTAADTVTVQVKIASSTKVIDIQGNTTASAAVNWFSGYLMV